MFPSPSEFLEDTRKENLLAKAASRTFLRPFFFPKEINCLEGVHPPEVSSPDLSKTTFIIDSSTPAYICGVRYTIRAFHISNMVHTPYFNASSYKKVADITTEIKSSIHAIVKDRNVKIVWLLNPA